MLDPVFIAGKRCEWADAAKRAVIEAGKYRGSPRVLEKSWQSLLALQTFRFLRWICQVSSKAIPAFVDDTDYRSSRGVKKIMSQIARHRQASEQHSRKQIRMGLARDGESCPLASG
jgi:hypothetical protein